MNNTTTTEVTTTTANAITGATKAKQNPLIVFPEDKTFVQDLKTEFGLKNDMEALKVLLTVATNYRFDRDGNDRFEAAAAELEAGRAKRKREDKIAKLRALMAELEDKTDTLESETPES